MEPCVVFRIVAPPYRLDRLVAELHSMETLGLEERMGPGDAVTLLAYFPAARPARDRVAALADPEVRIEGPEAVPDTDWEREWRRGLVARRIGPLWVRASWLPSPGTPELVIDPEQAFGSGEHASTRLALELLADGLRAGDRVLDVGTGSGVLALGSLRLGAASAVGVDVDPVACAAAEANARRNGLSLEVVCGEADALASDRTFDVVVANLLLGELLAALPGILRRSARAVVLAGYLEAERGRLASALEGSGWESDAQRDETQSGDRWWACRLHQALPRQSSSTSLKLSSKV